MSPEDLSYLLEERIAIAEIEGGLSPDEARALAEREVYGASGARPGLAKAHASDAIGASREPTGTE